MDSVEPMPAETEGEHRWFIFLRRCQGLESEYNTESLFKTSVDNL